MEQQEQQKRLKIAVVTGASSGMGAEFARRVCADSQFSFDEIWLIARREERLLELAKTLPLPARTLTLDLTDSNAYNAYAMALLMHGVEISLLVNAAGFGIFAPSVDVPLNTQLAMIDLNAKALTALTALSIPYMRAGAAILNICSLSAFQPVPYINVYAATKAYTLSYSRALNVELRDRGIRVMGICPGWVNTEFFDTAEKDKNRVVPKKTPLWAAAQVVDRALKDFKRGKDVSVLGFIVRLQVLLVKLLPHKWIMWLWLKQQGH